MFPSGGKLLKRSGKEENTMAVQTEKIVNGVDAEMVQGAAEAVKAQPDLAQFKFRIHNNWVDGAHNHSIDGNFYGLNKENVHLQQFEWDADEPPALAGKDRGANPVEHLLNALAACVTTAIVYHASIRGIKIEALESDLEGDLDLRGLLGVSSDVRPGFRNIRMNFKVKTDEKNPEKLAAFKKFSPVFDMVTNGTSVEVNIEKK
jgi:uncharacterized OsmC-like protein